MSDGNVIEKLGQLNLSLHVLLRIQRDVKRELAEMKHYGDSAEDVRV